jgi:redox-sensitive bicupin YhaK (pirin superfamily)
MNVLGLSRMNLGAHFRATTLRGPHGALGPFLGVDHAWMSAPTFPPHSHGGMSAVSYVFLDSEAGVENKDDIGTHNIIRPGGLHWTTAGRGITHDEVPAEVGKTVHSLQIFVDLAPADRAIEAAALSLEPEDVPVTSRGDVRVRVPLGSYEGLESPLETPTDVTMLEVCLNPGAAWSLQIPAGDVLFALPIYGAFQADGVGFAADGMEVPLWPAADTAREVRVIAGDQRVLAMFFSGRRLD